MSTWFQGLFHPPLGVLFTFPSRYWFTIGRYLVFSLGGWSPLLPTSLLVARGTQDPAIVASTVLYGALTRSGGAFQHALSGSGMEWCGPTTPKGLATPRFGLVPVRSPLLRESRLISCLGLLRCFSSPAALVLVYVFNQPCRVITLDGLPHSDTEGSSLACSSPSSFRRSPRPSSAGSAQASTSYSL